MTEHGSTPERPVDSGLGRPAVSGEDRTRPDPGTALELARVDVRRGVRWALAQDVWVLYGLVAAAGFAFMGWISFNFGRTAGQSLAAGESAWLLSTGAWTVWSVLWLFAVGLLAVDAVGSNGDLDADGYYLSVLPVPDLVGGKLLASAAKFTPFVLALALPGHVGIALGAGQPLSLVGCGVATLLVVASATAVGYPLGLALKGLVRRSATLTRLKPLLGGALGVAYLGVMFSGEFTTVVARIEPALGTPPLGWLGDLALLTTTGVGVSPAGAAGALAVGAVATTAGTTLAVPAARYAWKTDRARPSADGKDGEATPPADPVGRLLGAAPVSQPTRGVAVTTLRRVVRSPFQLVFAAVPLLAAIPMGEQVLTTGAVPWYAPWLVVWYGAWAAGAAVPLNPLGAQGATLPALLSSPADGGQVVRGHVVAAALPVAPLTAAAAVGVGVLGDQPTSQLVAVGVAAVAVVVAASVLAAGIGATFPRFEAVDLGNAREAVPPSKVAFAVFGTALSLSVVAVAVVTEDLARQLAAALLTRSLPLNPTVGPDAVATAGWVVLCLAALSVPLAYRVGATRIAEYRL
jgi:ABC-2 type transport system permease protein